MSQDLVARGTETEISLMGIRNICIHADFIRTAIAKGGGGAMSVILCGGRQGARILGLPRMDSLAASQIS